MDDEGYQEAIFQLMVLEHGHLSRKAKADADKAELELEIAKLQAEAVKRDLKKRGLL